MELVAFFLLRKCHGKNTRAIEHMICVFIVVRVFEFESPKRACRLCCILPARKISTRALYSALIATFNRKSNAREILDIGKYRENCRFWNLLPNPYTHSACIYSRTLPTKLDQPLLLRQNVDQAYLFKRAGARDYLAYASLYMRSSAEAAADRAGFGAKSPYAMAKS